ncbi:AAA family ATPase [Apiospora arundinis]
MDKLGKLEAYSRQLSAAIKSLSAYRRRLESPDPLDAESELDKELHSAKAEILAAASGIRCVVAGPTNLLQHLACQVRASFHPFVPSPYPTRVELLACLRWLSEFQILACIPLQSSVPIKDVATLAGIQDHDHLARVIRFVATHEFLQVTEPQASVVSHTPLSAQFIANPSYVDALMFLSDTQMPSALHMAPATQHSLEAGWAGTGTGTGENAYNLALSTTKPFHVARPESPRWQRCLTAFLDHSAGVFRVKDTADMLGQLNWSNLSNACVVEPLTDLDPLIQVGAKSTALVRYLAKRYQGLRLVVQKEKESPDVAQSPTHAATDLGLAIPPQNPTDKPLDFVEPDLKSRILVTDRPAGSNQHQPQSVVDAAVYILHTDAVAPAAVLAQLQDHFGILRAHGSMLLVLASRCLPEPGVLGNPEAEAVARARDLSMHQLLGATEWEMMDLLTTIESVGDDEGKLIVTDRLCSRDNVVRALAVKYQELNTVGA